MSTLATLPASIDVGTGELFVYDTDVTNALLDGESLQATPPPTAQVFANSNNAVISAAIVGSPGVSGNTVQINLDCSKLKPKQTYTIVATYYVTATKRLQFITQLNTIV